MRKLTRRVRSGITVAGGAAGTVAIVVLAAGTLVARTLVARTPLRSTDEPVVLFRSGVSFDQEPEVFIPVGTPGIDHVGRAFRTDGVVSVPLRKLRDSGLPSTFDVLTAVEKAL